MQAVERYPVKTDRHSSHSIVLRMCGEGAGRRLLDVGCARGHLGSVLADAGWAVTGIEADATDAAAARTKGLNVIEQSAEMAFGSMTEKFDVIVFADVLEHMVDPLMVLNLARQRLLPGGRIIVSIPNVAHLTVRAQLMLGRFNYADRGIMDRTHLRFFTRRTLIEMIREVGLSINEIRVTPAPIEEVFPIFRRSRFLRPILEVNALFARAWKSGLAYQYVVECSGIAGQDDLPTSDLSHRG